MKKLFHTRILDVDLKILNLLAFYNLLILRYNLTLETSVNMFIYFEALCFRSQTVQHRNKVRKKVESIII